MIVAAFALSGCGAKLDGEVKKPPKERMVQSVQTNAAEGTRYSEGPDRKAVWKVRWNRQELTFGEGGVFFGDMYEVSGSFFKGGAEASRFRADKAHVDQQSNVLVLEGRVEIETSDPRGEISCERAIWHPEGEYGEAHGNVRYTTDEYTMGPFPVFRFSAELKAGGTPDLFREKYGE